MWVTRGVMKTAVADLLWLHFGMDYVACLCLIYAFVFTVHFAPCIPYRTIYLPPPFYRTQPEPVRSFP